MSVISDLRPHPRGCGLKAEDDSQISLQFLNILLVYDPVSQGLGTTKFTNFIGSVKSVLKAVVDFPSGAESSPVMIHPQ